MNLSSISRVHQLHPFQSWYLHPNRCCCQLLQSDVWTLLTSLTLKFESATAVRSTISSARKPKNHSSEEIHLENRQLISSTDFQKVSHFRFVHKDNAKWCGESSGSLVLLLFTRFSWDCMEISMHGSSEVYRSRPDVLGCFACSPAQTFLDAAPG